jgi:hypothetical protein
VLFFLITQTLATEFINLKVNNYKKEVSYFVSCDSGSETYNVFWPVECGTKNTAT